MTLAGIGFLQPLMLTALAALPVIWWLLRFTPPRPVVVAFPPVRLLLGLRAEEETPARSPWWLTALRILIAAVIIVALAGPVLNPQEGAGNTARNLILVVDNGWASASRWTQRQDMIASLLQRAEGRGQTVTLVASAGPSASQPPETMTPAKAREKAASLEPMPYAPDRAGLALALGKAIQPGKGHDAVWLADGLDAPGTANLAAALQSLTAGHSFALVTDTPGSGALGLAARADGEKGLAVRVTSPGGITRAGRVAALSGRGARLGEVEFSLTHDAKSAEAAINLPLELRNQVTRLEIDGETSAGATYLLDSRSLWQRFAVLSGEARESAQPLLSPTHYIERALSPSGEVAVSPTTNVERGSEELLARNPSALILANIGQITGESEARLRQWVQKGGVLVRFAGPRLEKGGDALLPVPLREGGRTLGGALSWKTPQKLAAFEENSPFYGLGIPADVLINRQVLADPAGQQRPEVQIWARLEDGTPLVTASRLGDGWLVLFHVSANSDWSNLPMSGLFVDMLRRTTELSNVTSEAARGEGGGASEAAGHAAASARTAFLTPWRILDGFGRMGPPAVNTSALPAANPDATPGPAHPPGFYGQPGRMRALNVMRPDASLKALDAASLGAMVMTYDARKPVLLMPWLLMAALALYLTDAVITLAMLSGGTVSRRRVAPRAAAMAAAAVLGFAAVLGPGGRAAAADEPGTREFALKASLTTRLAYVITGDAAIDDISARGLSGLSKVLNARTAIEPGDPMGVDIERDELVFFPLIYWPVRTDARPLSDATLAKVDAYMKQGGMIVFDTRDYQMPLGGGTSVQGLSNLIGRLDTPRLEPVPAGHVLTKSFYLLSGFPGRWDGGTMWVEAQTPDESGSGERRALKADGVSSILVTSNDLAGAWALDDDNRPMFATVPGGDMQREMAFRAGVNIVMYALTGNYKADQVHVPALLERLGQ